MAVVRPNLGLWLTAPLIDIPDGALSDGHNFRISNGRLSNLNLGWSRFGTFQLGITTPGGVEGDPVTLIDGFFDRDSNQTLIFGTAKFLFKYVDDATVELLNRVYSTGTVSVTNGSPTVTGAGTTWSTNLAVGDFISVGSPSENDPTATWYEIASVDTDTQVTLVDNYGGSTAGAAAYTGLKAFTGDLTTPWETVTFLHEGVADEDLWIATNGVDDIVTWNGADPTVISAGLSFKAFHLCVFKNMVLYFAITESGEFLPTQLRNSDVGFPLDVSGGLASAFTVHEGSDELAAAIPLGDSLIAYSERHIHVLDFVGDPFVFVIRTGVPNIGPITGRLVGDFGDTHSFLGPDAQYDFDGVTVKEAGNQVWRAVLRQRDPQRTLHAFSHFDEENGDLIWAIPLLGDGATSGPGRAFVEHYLEETKGDISPISSRDFPFTATGFFERQSSLSWDDISDQWQDMNFRWNDIFFSAAFPFNLAGDVDGFVYTFGTTQTGDGDLLVSHVRAPRRPLGDTRMRGLLRRVYPFATQFTDLTLQVRTRLSDSAAGPVTVVDQVDFPLDMDDGGHFATIHRRGRFYELEFGTSGTQWELAGWDVDISAGGRR